MAVEICIKRDKPTGTRVGDGGQFSKTGMWKRVNRGKGWGKSVAGGDFAMGYSNSPQFVRLVLFIFGADCEKRGFEQRGRGIRGIGNSTGRKRSTREILRSAQDDNLLRDKKNQ